MGIIKVEVFDHQVDVDIDTSSVRNLVSAFMAWRGYFKCSVCVYFVSKKIISSLHQEHFSDNSPTDCITFPMDSPSSCDDGVSGVIGGVPLFGEVVVCPLVGIEYTGYIHDLAVREITLYIVHGLLHLIGFEDSTSLSRARMSEEEQKSMLFLSSRGLLLKLGG